MPAESAVRVHRLCKKFASQTLFDDFSLDFTSGEVSLLLGHNGSGKTTLLRMCAGLLRAEGGHIYAAAEKRETKKVFSYELERTQLGHFGHQLFLYGRLSVRENIAFYASLAGVSVNADEQLERWRLKDFQDKQVGELSQGQRCRVSLCRALMHEPRYIFLDEPSSALDDASAELLCGELAKLKSAERTIVIATHDLNRMRGLASRIVTLAKGKVEVDSGREGASGMEGAVARYRELNR